MHEHTAISFERNCDVLVVGGSAAGLAAGLQIARQRRSVIVVDAGEPRNAPAAHMHGFLGRDGTPPSDLAVAGRAEVRSYGGEVLDGRVQRVTRSDDGVFRAELTGGHEVTARRVVIATGLVDDLPDIPGVAEHWGRGVIHCPFCHGYEARDQRIVQVVTHPMGLHAATLFRHLSPELTIVIHDGTDVDLSQLEVLESGGVTVVHGRVEGIVAGPDGQITAVEMAEGDPLAADVVVVGPRFAVRAEPFDALGLSTTAHPSGMGAVVDTDSAGGTSIEGVYAAGNVTDPSHQVISAAANGGWVGAMVSFSLADEDLKAVARPSANEADWDHRYSQEHLWSGNPNGTLVNELANAQPGRALDVGAGEGGDAVWLAEQGWDVVATDISQNALERIEAEAQRRSLSVGLHHADANAPDAFDQDAFDLVTASYASIPRTPDDRGIHNMIGAVAPGGTLVVVSHDLEPMRTTIDTRTDSRRFDPDAYVRVEDVVAVLEESPEWEIEVHETRQRPAGAASAGHHVDDVVLRARRRSEQTPSE